MKSNVAVVIDICVKRAESQITKPICAMKIIQMREEFSANIVQNATDCDRKYATRPVIESAAAICI
jgi:hypothetical protein